METERTNETDKIKGKKEERWRCLFEHIYTPLTGVKQKNSARE